MIKAKIIYTGESETLGKKDIVPLENIVGERDRGVVILGCYISTSSNFVLVKVQNTRYNAVPNKIKLVRLKDLCSVLGRQDIIIEDIRYGGGSRPPVTITDDKNGKETSLVYHRIQKGSR